MKKTIAVLFAVMMMLLSAVPAFAAVSPQPNTFKYKVEVIPTEGGNGNYKFTTGIDEKGEQHVFIEPLPYDGYVFDHWEISGGPFRTDSKYTDAKMNIIISGDLVCTPYYRMASSECADNCSHKQNNQSYKKFVSFSAHIKNSQLVILYHFCVSMSINHYLLVKFYYNLQTTASAIQNLIIQTSNE